jgi:hypothetical protein
MREMPSRFTILRPSGARRVRIGHLDLTLVPGLEQIGPAPGLGNLLFGEQLSVKTETQRADVDAQSARLGRSPLA